jgi:autotransporter-associated beta strand protein
MNTIAKDKIEQTGVTAGWKVAASEEEQKALTQTKDTPERGITASWLVSQSRATRQRNNPSPLVVSIAVGLVCLIPGGTQSANGAALTWDGGGGSGDWSDAANWNGTLTTGDSVTFTGNTETSTNNTLSGFTLAGITFNNTGGNSSSFTLAGNQITLGGNIITTGSSGSPSHTISLDIILNGDRIINTALDNDIEVSGIISGVGGLTKEGAGHLILSGANTFTGQLKVDAGTVSIDSIADAGSASAAGAAAGDDSRIRLGKGPNTGTLEYTGSGSSTNRQVIIGNQAATGSVGGATIEQNGSGPLVFTNTVEGFNDPHSGANAARTLTLGGTNTDANEIKGKISDNNTASGGTIAVTKTGAGRWILSGNNTYTGRTTVNAGTLSVSSDGNLGAVPGSPVANQLQLDGGTLLTKASFNMSANRGLTLGAAGGTIETASTTTLTLLNILTGGGALTKTGDGKLQMTVAATFTGATTVDDGTLEAAAEDALGATSGITVSSGGTLLLTNTGTTDRIKDSAPMTLAGGTLKFSGNVSETTTLGMTPGTGALTLSASSIIDFDLGNVVINFGASNLETWTGTLSIYNWDGLYAGGGNDRLIFGTDGTALTSGPLGQLAKISFYSDNGTMAGFLGTGQFVGAVGEVVPVPEPSSVMMTLGLLGLAGWRERRRTHGRLREARSRWDARRCG